ncbi:GTPase HflX [bacterium M21]|nr:GTPase HflX [bacterium M21]
MFDLAEKRDSERGRALLISAYQHQSEEDYHQEMLEELDELVCTCGAEVVGRMAIRVRGNHPRLLVGKGKAEEVVNHSRELGADVLIFDESLSPAQQRNWERLAGIRIMDRQEVILTIFGNRASTKEAELQIELAQAAYMLPRMKNLWTHLDRQRGVVGLRGGEGEKQIEIDNRLLRRRIAQLKRELKKVQKQRAQQRKRRQTVPIPNAAIVGYTNAGKSLLLNQLTNADVLVEDKLFATLDPTTRRIELENQQVMLVTDTVGFVRNLPHDLVEAFKATLEEAVLANFLIHVVDINNSSLLDHMETTMDVLKEIGAGGQEVIVAFNKIDIAEAHLVRRMRHEFPDAMFISAKTGDGIEDLIARVTEIIDEYMGSVRLLLPMDRFDLLAMLHRIGNVLEEVYEEDGIHLKATIPLKSRHELEKYIIAD